MTHFDEPIIIVGFGHSGSRLLAELLSDCGVFQVQNTPAKEWTYIQRVNDRIWAKWYSLDGATEALVRDNAVKINKASVLSRIVVRGYRGGYWGIKDPRLTITVPAWLERFPKAKIIHLVRNPLDVIGTLSPNYAPYTPGGKLPQEELPFWTNLWVESLDWLLASASQLGNSQFVELKYEDLCDNPNAEMDRLITALDLQGCKANKLDVSRIKKAENKYESWLKKEKLKLHDLETISASTSKYMSRYRYAQASG